VLGYHFSETSYDLLEGGQEILFEGRSGRWLFWLRLFLDMLVGIFEKIPRQDSTSALLFSAWFSGEAKEFCVLRFISGVQGVSSHCVA